jgi:membrane-associated phospholipid phosphatase
MNTELLSSPRRRSTLFWCCFAAGLLLMLVVGVNDRVWTQWLIDLRLIDPRWVAFADFMENSAFEGEPFGGGDPVLILLILVCIAYVAVWLPRVSSRLLRWRPQLGFTLSSGLLCGLVMVHSLKNVVGRARPDKVLDGHLPFSSWYEFGPYFLPDGAFNGSFPSGHTAQAFIPMAIAFCLLAYPQASRRQRLAGYAVALLGTLYVAAMAASRCISVSHWLSDVCASVLLSWLFYYLLYFRVLRVPQQALYWQRNGRAPLLPTAWELRLSLLIVLVVAGLMAALIGARAVVMQRPLSLWLLLPLGLAWAAWFRRLAVRLQARAVAAFAADADR